jgi:hypothetical protein
MAGGLGSIRPICPLGLMAISAYVRRHNRVDNTIRPGRRGQGAEQFRTRADRGGLLGGADKMHNAGRVFVPSRFGGAPLADALSDR